MIRSPRPGFAPVLALGLPLLFAWTMDASGARAERFARTVWVEKFGYAA